MPRNLLMSFTEGIQGSLDDDWKRGVGLDVLQGFYVAYFVMDLGPVQMASTRVIATSGDKSSTGGVFPFTESSERLLIGH
jgi:hypothetical protein